MQDFDQILTWPAEDYSRVPYRVFTDQNIFEAEQERIWKGPVWNYLALEAEVPKPGDFLVTYVGDTPVVVNRAEDGSDPRLGQPLRPPWHHGSARAARQPNHSYLRLPSLVL